MSALLEVRDLTVDFRTRGGIVHGLKGVSFSVEKGRTLGIVGESGSGKSISAHNILRILDRAGRVVRGSIAFEGVDIVDASESLMTDIRGKRIAMIFQNPRGALNPIRPVGAQIADVLRRHMGMTARDAADRAVELLETVRIRRAADRAGAYPFELSGGMCQRVMIAIALACEPRLLIADEPTTGLDATTQKTIMDLIRDLTRDRGMSAILITHDLGLAAEYCDDIVVMRRGEVVEAAPTRDLFRAATHPYTQRLIQATPRRDSSLKDIDVAPDEAAEAAVAPALPPATASARPVSAGTPLLQVENLVKTYRLRETSLTEKLRASAKRMIASRIEERHDDLLHAVDDISLTLPVGGSLGVVGESGSGKSTLSSMIARLIDPTAGRILFDGAEISAIPAARFARAPERRLIQMVFQDPTESLNPRFTAADCIADPLKRLEGLKPGPALNDRVRELAAMVGLPDHLLGRFPHQLSGGQKARVGIARGLAPQPRLLILDEPTSALDVSVQAVVLNLLDRLRAALGVGYLFVSHDLNVVRLLCDEVIVVNRGKVVERGTSRAVLENPQAPYTRTLIDAIPHFAP